MGIKNNSTEVALRKNSIPAAEKATQAKQNPAHLAKARKFEERSKQGGKAAENAVAGKD